MACVSVPVVHRENGAQGTASHVSGVQSKRRVCPRAPQHDEQARRVRIPGGREPEGSVGRVCRREGRGDTGIRDVYWCFTEPTREEEAVISAT